MAQEKPELLHLVVRRNVRRIVKEDTVQTESGTVPASHFRRRILRELLQRSRGFLDRKPGETKHKINELLDARAALILLNDVTRQ